MNTDTNIIVAKLPNLRSKIYFFIKIIITASLLIYLFSYVQINTIIETFTKANSQLIILSLLLLIPNLYLQYWKWQITCRQFFGEQSRRKILFSLFYGFPAAVFTPARAGEYVGRGLMFKEHSFSDIVLAIFIDKFFTILVTFLIGTAGTLLFVNKFYATNIFVSLPLLNVFLICFTFAIALLFTKKEWLFTLISPLLKYKLVLKVKEKLLLLKKLSNKYVLIMLLISALFLLCYLLQFMILIAAFSLHFDVVNYFWAAVLIMFTKSLLSPISLSELGVREGAAVFFLTKIGETSSTALNASLALFAINIIIPSLIGLVLLFVKSDD